MHPQRLVGLVVEQIEEPDSLRPEDLAGRFGVLLNDSVPERRMDQIAETPFFRRHGLDGRGDLWRLGRPSRPATGPDHALSLVYQRYSVLARNALRGLHSWAGPDWRPIACPARTSLTSTTSAPT